MMAGWKSLGKLRRYLKMNSNSRHKLDRRHCPQMCVAIVLGLQAFRRLVPFPLPVTPHARSEDLHHTHLDNNSDMALSASPSGSPMPGFQALSRPLTPNDSRSGAPSSDHSESGTGFTDDSTTLK